MDWSRTWGFALNALKHSIFPLSIVFWPVSSSLLLVKLVPAGINSCFKAVFTRVSAHQMQKYIYKFQLLWFTFSRLFILCSTCSATSGAPCFHGSRLPSGKKACIMETQQLLELLLALLHHLHTTLSANDTVWKWKSVDALTPNLLIRHRRDQVCYTFGLLYSK